jgi:hypothetical protein
LVRTLLGLASVTALAACSSEDLGVCDMTAATSTYYLDGVPYYAGQALVHQSCAGSFCHAEGAMNAARKGAPHGVNFDDSPLLASSTTHDVSVLKSGVHTIREDADKIYSRVDDGSMPPGAAGKRPELAWKTVDSSGVLADAPLPSITSKAGKDLLRKWLACDAPIVAYTPSAPAQEQMLGASLPIAMTKIDPTFDGIYKAVLSGTCASCHNDLASNPFKSQQALDFSTADAAYASLVGKDPFATGACAKHGKLVVANDSKNSLLWQKLVPKAEEPADFCGDQMPLGGPPASQTVIDAVKMWIDSGAAR